MESAAESIVLHVLGLALMLAGLPVGWPLPGQWNLLQNRLFYMSWGLRRCLLAFRLAGPCLEGGICCRIECFTCSGACADACWPSGWLALAWKVESAAESIVLHVLGLALMLAGLPIGWPLPGGWNLLQNRSFYMLLTEPRKHADTR